MMTYVLICYMDFIVGWFEILLPEQLIQDIFT